VIRPPEGERSEGNMFFFFFFFRGGGGRGCGGGGGGEGSDFGICGYARNDVWVIFFKVMQTAGFSVFDKFWTVRSISSPMLTYIWTVRSIISHMLTLVLTMTYVWTARTIFSLMLMSRGDGGGDGGGVPRTLP